MFSKQESAILKQQFWTSFGQYMLPVPSAEGLKINWVNYKTGVKDLQFKMEAGTERATIGIMLTHKDPARQTFFFNLLQQLRPVLEDILQEEWIWDLHTVDENNRVVSSIHTGIKEVNIFRKEDWPSIISFFKPRMMALDAFWAEVKFGFEGM